MPNKKIYKLFPTPIFECKLEKYDELNNELEKYIYELKKKMKKD